MKRALYICTSQYQIFNAVNIANGQEYRKFDKDLLILDIGSGLIQQLNLKKMKEIFTEIFIYRICTFSERKDRVYTFLGRELISRSPYGMDLSANYTDVFITGTEMHSKIVALRYQKHCAKVHFFEDGLESYDSILHTGYKHKQDTILKAVYGYRSLDVCEDLYVYNPDFVINNSRNLPLCKIDPPARDAIINITTGVPARFHKKFVFLSAWFKDIRMYEEQDKYISILFSEYPDDYCVKKHPSDTKIEHEKKYNIEDCGNFEIANAIYDMSDNIFVTIISTAGLTPFLLYKKKPNVIFLYKIFLNSFNMPEWSKTDIVIKRMVQKMSYEGRAYFPENIEQYKTVLRKLGG